MRVRKSNDMNRAMDQFCPPLARRVILAKSNNCAVITEGGVTDGLRTPHGACSSVLASQHQCWSPKGADRQSRYQH